MANVPSNGSTAPQASASLAPSPATLSLELLRNETRGQLAVCFRVTESGRAYRLMPVREPAQPRLWLLALVPCHESGVPMSANAVWAGHWGTERAALSGLLTEVSEDLPAWISAPAQARLRAVLSDPEPIPSLLVSTLPSPGGQSLRSSPRPAR
jgi:hypothetical protein